VGTDRAGLRRRLRREPALVVGVQRLGTCGRRTEAASCGLGLAAADLLRVQLGQRRELIGLRGRQTQRDVRPVLTAVLRDDRAQLEARRLAVQTRDVARRPARGSDLILEVERRITATGLRDEIDLDVLALLVRLRAACGARRT